MYRLAVSIKCESEEEGKSIVKILQQLSEILEKTEVALLRDGDRSGGNLLLPKLQGRFGEHLQGRKAKLKEL